MIPRQRRLRDASALPPLGLWRKLMARHQIMTVVASVAFGAGAMVAPQSLQAAEGPAMGGGYTNVTPIPVKDPAVKEIAGALVKPQGAGPFPVVVYIPPCGGPNFPL